MISSFLMNDSVQPLDRCNFTGNLNTHESKTLAHVIRRNKERNTQTNKQTHSAHFYSLVVSAEAFSSACGLVSTFRGKKSSADTRFVLRHRSLNDPHSSQTDTCLTRSP